jgi:hypothetical protein
MSSVNGTKKDWEQLLITFERPDDKRRSGGNDSDDSLSILDGKLDSHP